MANDSGAPTKRPENSRSLALAGPTSRGSRWVPPAPGMTPSNISGNPSWAFSAHTRKSAHSASSHPPPNAYPVIAAMTGLGMSATALKQACKRTERFAMSVGEMSTISLMSAPAAKTRSPP
nr:hypothetical protein [Sporichthya sp.]